MWNFTIFCHIEIHMLEKNSKVNGCFDSNSDLLFIHIENIINPIRNVLIIFSHAPVAWDFLFIAWEYIFVSTRCVYVKNDI